MICRGFSAVAGSASSFRAPTINDRSPWSGGNTRGLALQAEQMRHPRCGQPRASSRQAVAEIRAELGGGDFQYIVAFFGIDHDAEVLAAALSEAFPASPSPAARRRRDRPVRHDAGRAAADRLPARGLQRPQRADHRHRPLRRRARDRRRAPAEGARGALTATLRPDNGSRMLLVDGLSNAEENIVAAINWELDDIELIGGSAGDGICFERTVMIHKGAVAHRAAILMMIESEFPFRVFKTQNFEPTAIKLVVTAADTENRIVYELNAEPAAREYASAIGLLPDDLGPFSFASYPLVVKVGGDYYCRSIRNMNPDGSLSFFCAIDEGLVFTVARPQRHSQRHREHAAGARRCARRHRSRRRLRLHPEPTSVPSRRSVRAGHRRLRPLTPSGIVGHEMRSAAPRARVRPSSTPNRGTGRMSHPQRYAPPLGTGRRRLGGLLAGVLDLGRQGRRRTARRTPAPSPSTSASPTTGDRSSAWRWVTGPGGDVRRVGAARGQEAGSAPTTPRLVRSRPPPWRSNAATYAGPRQD